MFSIRKRENLEKIEGLASLHNQADDLWLQDKLGKGNFHEKLKNLYEPLTDTIEVISRDLTKTMIESYKAISDLIEKVSEIVIDKGMLSPFLASSSINLFSWQRKQKPI